MHDCASIFIGTGKRLEWKKNRDNLEPFIPMNIHEYQAKQLFEEAGVTVPKGTIAQSADQFDTALSFFPACLLYTSDAADE